MRPRRILLIHNYYQEPGGEDLVFSDEGSLLERRGHNVARYTTSNDTITGSGSPGLLHRMLWNSDAYRELRSRIRRDRIDLVHCHNIFPLISPAAYYAAAAEGVPVVQTLHNYRLLCPNALFFRDGHSCEDCLGRRVAWPGVLHAYYRSRRTATAATALMTGVHRLFGTWARLVAVYIALTDFARQKFIAGGLPAEKLVVKPNFVLDEAGPGSGQGNYALCVARLTREKGILCLLNAWNRVRTRLPLWIVGNGPLAPAVRAQADTPGSGVHWLGSKKPSEVRELMREAAFVVVPSEWYETFGRVVIEAFASGTPVVTADIGALAELVDPGRTGLQFHAGDADHLARQVHFAIDHPTELRRMRAEARLEFEAKYREAQNYEALMAIYHQALGRAPTRSGVPNHRS